MEFRAREEAWRPKGVWWLFCRSRNQLFRYDFACNESRARTIQLSCRWECAICAIHTSSISYCNPCSSYPTFNMGACLSCLGLRQDSSDVCNLPTSWFMSVLIQTSRLSDSIFSTATHTPNTGMVMACIPVKELTAYHHQTSCLLRKCGENKKHSTTSQDGQASKLLRSSRTLKRLLQKCRNQALPRGAEQCTTTFCSP